MFLAWRDMLFARTRFLLMGLVLGLMSILIVIISGLTAGLVNEGVSGLKAMNADVIAFEDGTQTDSAFTRSVINLSATDDLATTDGVDAAAPMSLTIVNACNQNATPVDLTLVGVEPDSFLAPEGLAPMESDGSENEPTSTPHDAVVSATLKDAGISVGDTITLDRLETRLNIVGFTDQQHTFGHVDIAYAPLDVWQEVHAGARAGEGAPDHAYNEASVVVAQTSDNTDPETLSTDSGLDVRTMEESFQSSPGYGPETMTLAMIEWFLYIITALVTGAFFLVWTIQRSGDIAIMRAMGPPAASSCATAWARPW